MTKFKIPNNSFSLLGINKVLFYTIGHNFTSSKGFTKLSAQVSLKMILVDPPDQRICLWTKIRR